MDMGKSLGEFIILDLQSFYNFQIISKSKGKEKPVELQSCEKFKNPVVHSKIFTLKRKTICWTLSLTKKHICF